MELLPVPVPIIQRKMGQRSFLQSPVPKSGSSLADQHLSSLCWWRWPWFAPAASLGAEQGPHRGTRQLFVAPGLISVTQPRSWKSPPCHSNVVWTQALQGPIRKSGLIFHIFSSVGPNFPKKKKGRIKTSLAENRRAGWLLFLSFIFWPSNSNSSFRQGCSSW